MLALPLVFTLQRRRLAISAVLALVCLALSACGAAANQSTGEMSMSTTPPTQAITVATDHATYSPATPIIVTLTNRRQASVFSADHQSLCAIVTLQRQTHDAWAIERPCRLMSPTRIIEVATGTTQITLAPGDTPWPTGAYRVVFQYIATRGDDMAAATTVTSATFTVA